MFMSPKEGFPDSGLVLNKDNSLLWEERSQRKAICLFRDLTGGGRFTPETSQR